MPATRTATRGSTSRRFCSDSGFAKDPPRLGERRGDARVVERLQRQRAVALAELLAVFVDDERQVRVLRRSIAEGALQGDLSSRRREEIAAAYDLRDRSEEHTSELQSRGLISY